MALTTQRITPFLWFDNQAEEAVAFYTSIFKNSKVLTTAGYTEEASQAAGRPAGSVMVVDFQLEGQRFTALNGGPHFKFNEAVSFYVRCKDQAEVDYYWNKLTADGGEESMCGWLKDRYGLSWQVVPAGMEEVFSDPDPTRAQRAMQAMLGMVKLDVEGLKRAYEGKSAA